MAGLFDTIRQLVAEEKYLVGQHASERLEERGTALRVRGDAQDNDWRAADYPKRSARKNSRHPLRSSASGWQGPVGVARAYPDHDRRERCCGDEEMPSYGIGVKPFTEPSLVGAGIFLALKFPRIAQLPSAAPANFENARLP